MSHRARALVGVALSLSFAVGLPATAAHAETYRHRDPVKDVWHDSYGTLTIAKADQVGDIKHLRVRLSKSNLVLKVWYRKINAKGTLNQIWWLKGAPKIVGAQYTLADDVVTMMTKSGTYPTCRGSSVAVSTEKDATTARIPVRCLNSPEQIKVSTQFKGYFYSSTPKYVSYDWGLVKGVGGTTPRYSRWIVSG